jgi:hypothetical protein
MIVTGGCHCGEITYEAEVDPATVRVCHCTDCQRLTGTAFRVNISAQPETFKLKRGMPKNYVRTAVSGNECAHAFCPECGTPISATSPEPRPASAATRLVAAVQSDGESRIGYNALNSAGNSRVRDINLGRCTGRRSLRMRIADMASAAFCNGSARRA